MTDLAQTAPRPSRLRKLGRSIGLLRESSSPSLQTFCRCATRWPSQHPTC
jgi:hypothetical protein